MLQLHLHHLDVMGAHPQARPTPRPRGRHRRRRQVGAPPHTPTECGHVPPPIPLVDIVSDANHVGEVDYGRRLIVDPAVPDDDRPCTYIRHC